MKSPLKTIDIASIYEVPKGKKVALPSRMAHCTPDTFRAIFTIASDLQKLNGDLILSDLFRSYAMQEASHNDYKSGKKKDFSPPPGGSFHEAGRAFDLDLDAIKVPLSQFWTIAAKYGVYPIIAQPNPSVSEAWHFDCRGSHQVIYQYYKDGKGKNFKAYTAAAASAILSIGVHVDYFNDSQDEAAIQSCLIRLGKDIGDMDGKIGKRTQKALEEIGVLPNAKITEILAKTEDLIQQKFPGEFE